MADAYTGSVAAPVARSAGVRTPALVAFDDERDILPVPFSIFERAEGRPLVDVGAYPQRLSGLWPELGRDLAVLHHGVTTCADPDGRLESHDFITEHQPLVGDLEARGLIGPEAAAWVTAVLDRLFPAVQGRGMYCRFVHGDAQPSNVMAVEGVYSAILDWDDAGWSDPVVDLRYVPLRAAAGVLDGYRSVAPLDGGSSAEQRLLWDKLTGALQRLERSPRPSDGHVAGTPAGPLVELLAAAADGDVPIMKWLQR